MIFRRLLANQCDCDLSCRKQICLRSNFAIEVGGISEALHLAWRNWNAFSPGRQNASFETGSGVGLCVCGGTTVKSLLVDRSSVT